MALSGIDITSKIHASSYSVRVGDLGIKTTGNVTPTGKETKITNEHAQMIDTPKDFSRILKDLFINWKSPANTSQVA